MAKIGFIGMGNMGTAIMRGLLKTYQPEELLFTSAHEAKMQKITEETGVAHVSTANECAEQVKYLVLAVKPQVLLNDAVTIPGVDIKQVPIIKGDTLSASIAAASIIAKVTRDRMMVAYDGVYPGYGFASNKGYGSKEHIEALKTMGPCEIHRRSFIKNFV